MRSIGARNPRWKTILKSYHGLVILSKAIWKSNTMIFLNLTHDNHITVNFQPFFCYAGFAIFTLCFSFFMPIHYTVVFFPKGVRRKGCSVPMFKTIIKFIYNYWQICKIFVNVQRKMIAFYVKTMVVSNKNVNSENLNLFCNYRIWMHLQLLVI